MSRDSSPSTERPKRWPKASRPRHGSRSPTCHILEEAGYTLGDVVKTTVLLQDIGDFAAMNAVYAGFFTSGMPARVCYQVAALPMGALVEIDAVAAK
jgi:2-iminobutanoate/2-iminopropanoate deaminase